jgi:hypothetical protein
MHDALLLAAAALGTRFLLFLLGQIAAVSNE